jgi:hypothetical protein
MPLMDMGTPGDHAPPAYTPTPAPPHTFTYQPAAVGHFLQHAAAQVRETPESVVCQGASVWAVMKTREACAVETEKRTPT